MAEYVGTENQVSLQKRLQEKQSWFKETPGAFNGGRILGFDDPDQIGWSHVAELAIADKLALFPLFHKDEIFEKITKHLGANWKTPYWLAYLGRPKDVIDVSRSRMEEIALPTGWTIDVTEMPSDDQIEAIQALNSETGVSPYPAYFSRGEAAPIVTICFADAEGQLKAAASGVMRYHPRSRLGGYLFAGMVSVKGDSRGIGMGKLANAVLMVESHARLSWKIVQEQAAPDNPASIAMIRACGLKFDEDLVSVVTIDSDETFTR